MKMAYWMRIAAGALLGLVGLVVLWRFVGKTWLTATVAPLLAVIGFLGSYFLVSADRPEEGYEQVLFDKPNTIVSALLVVVFVGAAIGTGFLHGAAPKPLTPEDRVKMLDASYQSAADAWAKKGTANETTAKISDARDESDRIDEEIKALPDGDAKKDLAAANDALANALDALKTCVEKGQRNCVSARLDASDATTALQKLDALPK